VCGLLAVYGLLLLYGIVLAHSTGPADAVFPTREDVRHLQKTIFAVLCGAAVILPHWRNFERWAYPVFLAALVGLVAVLFVGTDVRGTRRWLNVGFSLQVSEIAKLALVFALARHLKATRDRQSLRTSLWTLCLTLLPAVLIVKEPDLGTSMLLAPVLFAMLFCAGGRARHIAAIVSLGILVSPFVFQFGLREYQKRRFTGFLSRDAAELDPDSVAQLHRALDAIGTGGFLGKGLGEGDRGLPERQSDMVFAVAAEELGFAGASVLLLAYMLLFCLCMEIAVGTHDLFARLTCVGVVTGIFVQSAVSAAMTMGLVPITGLNLPLVSQGGSSSLTTSLCIGVVVNIGLRPPHSLARPARRLRP